jgi:hypothetical protein
MLTKQDFEALADTLAAARPNVKTAAWPMWLAIRASIASHCAASNPLFDRFRFVRATEKVGAA